jgi:Ubiquitin-conjugating enzyme
MRTSLLGQAIEELLRNDSISDCSERAELYASFLSALQAISTNPRLAEFYTSERDVIERSDGLEQIISGQGMLVKANKSGNTGTWGSYGNPVAVTEKSPPLLELMQTLGKQAETFCKTAGKISGGLNTADTTVVNSINLCQNIISVRQSLQTSASQAFQQGVIPAPMQKQLNGAETYRLACARLAYDEIPSSATDAYFRYQHLASTITSINPRRTITLAKELSTMATSLPPGIFIRNIANRPDCIKALIIGPEDTPYHGGIWEFDIFAPANYPAEPPLVNLVTTANGNVQFGPNLYA